mmetsp:Transcript_8609/g.21759  ORF Transcript_8609/g.21759 Transcript_8609/m.21759 type:complete len:244 (-) Transcript_8609:252-983(-)|eukprot:jgi/Tetstr1/440423/TSEL_028757.t1
MARTALRAAAGMLLPHVGFGAGPAGAASLCWRDALPGCGQLQPSRGVTGMPSPTKLDEVVRLDKFEQLSKEQCVAMWEEFHKDSAATGRLGFTMETEQYRRFSQRAAESPLFVLPVVKPGGAFFNMIAQCQVPHVLCTSVEEYRSLGANAPAHVTVTHYTELQDSKGVVLGRADITSNSGDVSPYEARTLLSLLHSYYLGATGYLKVHTFNHQPDAFSFEELLSEVQAVDAALKAAPTGEQGS